MNENERRVLEIVNVKGVVSTDDLCALLNISQSTARRALVKLSERNQIHRYHGGGQSLGDDNKRSAFNNRFDQKPEDKDRIARAASAHVVPGSRIILLGGTTVYRMCKYLKGVRITVITNSMRVLDELRSRRDVDCIVLGGAYNYDEVEMRGVLTNTNLRMLRADSLFMGATQFHPKHGFLTNDLESIELYRLCIEAVGNCYVLADSTKLHGPGIGVTATNDMVDTLITDRGLDPSTVREFEDAGVTVECV